MNEIVYASPHKRVDAKGDNASFRIRQVETDDCIVESSLDGEAWEASDDDAMCSLVYMEAFLQAKRESEFFKQGMKDEQEVADKLLGRTAKKV